MKATIVIPNINGKGWLKDSIESVYAQTEQDFELIIVIGSTDESLEQARSYCGRPNFTLIENGTNTGFSHAVNQGIARAKGEYVVMFNNDAFAEPEWLAELIRTAETDPKIFAVQSLMLRTLNGSWPTMPVITSPGWALPARPAMAAGPAATPNRSASSRPAAARRSTARAFWRRSAPLTRTSSPTLRMWT